MFSTSARCHLRGDRTAAHGVGLVALSSRLLFRKPANCSVGDLHLAFQAADLLLQVDALGVADHFADSSFNFLSCALVASNSALVRPNPAGCLRSWRRRS